MLWFPCDEVEVARGEGKVRWRCLYARGTVETGLAWSVRQDWQALNGSSEKSIRALSHSHIGISGETASPDQAVLASPAAFQ